MMAVRLNARYARRDAPPGGSPRDRSRRTRLRGRRRSRRGRYAIDTRARRSQSPAGMQRDNAAGESLMRRAGEARGAHHGGEVLRLREPADRFDQVAIRFRVAGNNSAKRRDHAKRVEIIERLEAGNIHRGKYEAQKAPADLQHAESLAQRYFDPGDVADAKGNGHGVEAAVGEWQRLGIVLGESNPVRNSAGCWVRAGSKAAGMSAGARLSDRQHIGVDIAHHRAGLFAAGRKHTQGDIASAPGGIEQHKWAIFRRIDRRHQRILPGTVQPERHQVVHQVVAAGDTAEYARDEFLLLVNGHAAIAEIGLLFFGVGHGWSLRINDSAASVRPLQSRYAMV